MNIYKTLVFAGANLLAFAVNASDSTRLEPVVSREGNANSTQALTDGELRTTEANHLQVFPGCKWGHAAFDPIQVGAEPLSQEVIFLHGEMEVA